jgi:transcriptional regulator with XRE-family HTH domain
MQTQHEKTVHDSAYQFLVVTLRASRREANITQTGLALELGMDQSYVSKYERAERRLDVVEVRAICRALKIDWADFLGKFDKELRKRGL